MKNKKLGLLIIVLIVVITGAALIFFSMTAQSGRLRVVQEIQNTTGLSAADIPKFLKEKLGAKLLKTKWVENKQDGTITLEIEAEKDQKVGTVSMKYVWNPKWVWNVVGTSGKVTPVNTQAKNWMEGKI